MIRHLFDNQFSDGILSETIDRTDRGTQEHQRAMFIAKYVHGPLLFEAK